MTVLEGLDRNGHISIHVDDQVFHVDSLTMSGGQIKALVGKDLQHQLFLESPGPGADLIIDDAASVKLRSGMRFYTVSPAVFGK